MTRKLLVIVALVVAAVVAGIVAVVVASTPSPDHVSGGVVPSREITTRTS